MMKSFYTVLFALFLLLPQLDAQNYSMDGTDITDCSGFFLDSGGSAGTYGANENLTTTICPDLTTGTHIQLIFSAVAIDAGDELCFFDGPDVTAPALACASDFDLGSPFIIQATAVNPGGCLTITFNSDGAGQGEGWSADMNCVPACQTILANLVSTNPPAMPADTGWIDICPGEGIAFVGAGIYPQSGAIYDHSDFTSAFTWNFGDGVISQGPTAYHVYDEPGGYIVQLTIEDQFGCTNTNFISQRVRVSTYPDFELGTVPDEICAGDTITLGAAIAQIDSTYDVSVTSTSGTFQTSGVISDSLALPDGVDTCYNTPITFSDFSPGQVLTDINDFISICVVMEHSWMFDLDVFLTCPDGTQIILQDQVFQGGVFLGEPIDGDGANPVPGLGYEYCWTPNSTNGTWTDYYDANTPGTLPSQDYAPFESFDNLLGCPLNGEWALEVCDQWASDNGFIFEWSINFESDLYPNVETFTPEIIDWAWNDNPSIFYTSPNNDSITASPQNAGTASYNFYVTNDFGCTYDTVVNIAVLPPTHPACHNCEGVLEELKDTSVCIGGVVMLDGAAPNSLSNQAVTFEVYSNEEFDNDIYPPAFPYQSTVLISNINPGTILDATNQIESVCLNLTHGFDSDVELYLEAPNGALLELSTDNGGTGNNYTNTCFTPVAAQAITAGSPPYTGDFQPEGDWTVLNGSPLNGNWTLRVADDQNGGGGTFLGWTITFTNENDITYSWDPSTDLSCLDCPDPEVTLNTTSTYYLEAQDAFGCLFHDTVEVEALAAIAAPEITCGIQGTDELLFNWPAVVGAGGYEISVDGGMNWLPANGALSHVIGGLLPGEMVEILIRATDGGSGCEPLIATSSCALLDCSMTIDTSSTIAPTCFSTPDGFVFMSASSAISPVDYMIDGLSPSGPGIGSITAGLHTVIAIDAVGCADTLEFVMPGPPEITIDLSVDSISCNGANDGAVTATALGGVAGFSYIWNTIPATFNETLNSLSPGTYTVTASDANNCTISIDATFTDAPATNLTMTQDSVNCFGETNGSATVVPNGGTAPFSYSWPNGQTTATASNLGIGTYEVTVTDFNNCVSMESITVLEPEELMLSFTSQNVPCFDTADGEATAVLTGAVEPITYLWSNGASDQINSGLAAGNYCLTILDGNGCTTENCLDITEPVAVQLSSSSTPTLCANGNEGTATITPSGGNGPFTYLWPDGQTTATALALTTGDYVVTVTDATMCESTLSVNVGEAAAMSLQVASNPTSCANTDDGDATASPSGGSGTQFAYQWDANAGLQTTPTATNLLPGNYCVTITNDLGCTITDCIDIVSPPAIVITDAFQTSITCFGLDNGAAEITVTGGTGVGTYTYVWDDPNAQFANPATMLTVGTYNVTVTDGNMCTETTAIEVTEPALLEASASSANISCFGLTDGTANVNPTGGTTPYAFSWSNGETTQELVGLSAGPQSVTVTDANGCEAIAMTTLTEPMTAVTATASQIFVACFESGEGEGMVVGAGGTGNYSYEWSNGITTDNATNLTVGTAEVTVTDDSGCSVMETITITELPEVIADIATVEPICFGTSTGQLGVNIVEGGLGGDNDPAVYPYIYIWDNGATDPYINNMPAGQTYSVTVSDAQGCTGETSVLLEEPDPVSFELSPTDISCNGFIDGSITVVNPQNTSGDLTYEWDANANNQTTETATALGVGDYNVTIMDTLGCTATNVASIIEPTAVDITFDIENNLCTGDESGAATIQVTGGTPGYTYTWPDGATTQAVENLSTGSYTITVIDANGCESTDVVDIVQPTALGGTIVSDTVSCFGSRDGRVVITPQGGTPPYLYQLDDSNFTGTTTHVGLESAEYSVVIQDANGCEWETLAQVGSPEPLNIFAGNDVTMDLGETTTLIPYPGNAVEPVQYFWTAPYTGTLLCADSTESCYRPVSITQNTITYTLKVIDANGCVDEETITVIVEKERAVYVPTAFTPNGDNVNNTLLVHGKDDIKIDLFRVYDRWGALVYEEARGFAANDGVTGWNGTFKGSMLNPGLYIWYIEASYIDGHKETFKGETTLLR